MGIEVTIIDDSDFVGGFASVVRTGELYMTSVRTMVDNVLAHLRAYTAPPSPHAITAYAMSHGRVAMPVSPPGPAKMDRLNILDHGNTRGVQIGTDWITTATFGGFRPQLARLAGNFESGGFAHLQHCEVGMNIPLIELFADAFGVPIVGGRGAHNPIYRANYGYYVRVYPTVAGTRRASDTFFWRP